MKPIRYELEAENEFSQAASWYEKQRPSLAFEFVGEVQGAEERIQHQPTAYAVAGRGLTRLGVRRIRVRRFPYALVFMELENEIRILAVAHARRRPGYWRERLRG